jgi:hypothetical protein
MKNSNRRGMINQKKCRRHRIFQKIKKSPLPPLSVVALKMSPSIPVDFFDILLSKSPGLDQPSLLTTLVGRKAREKPTACVNSVALIHVKSAF